MTRATELCSRHICNNHGRCIRRRMDSDAYLHLDPNPTDGISTLELANRTLSQQQKVKMEQEFACHCYKGWSGKRCLFKGHSVRLWADSWCIYSTVLSVLWVRYLWAIWTSCYKYEYCEANAVKWILYHSVWQRRKVQAWCWVIEALSSCCNSPWLPGMSVSCGVSLRKLARMD